MAGALSRNIQNFSRFLQQAAVANAQIVNLELIASDAQVPARTVREYYTLLEDTLLGYLLLPLDAGGKKAVSKGKFYFFDIGVVHQLQGSTSLPFADSSLGDAFETLIHHELRSYIDYHDRKEVINYWRTHTGMEVDFVIGKRIGLEVKSSANVSTRDLRGLKSLSDATDLQRKIVVSRDPERRVLDGVEIWPYQDFLTELWSGKIIEPS